MGFSCPIAIAIGAFIIRMWRKSYRATATTAAVEHGTKQYTFHAAHHLDHTLPALDTISYSDDQSHLESSYQASLSLPNILAYNVNPFMSYMTMEYVNGGDLHGVFEAPEEMVKIVLSHLGATMAYLHVVEYAHRDIKPANVGTMHYADGSQRFFVFDMGQATNQQVAETEGCGTPLTMAPEVSAGGKYDSCPVDWYSFGVTVLCLSLSEGEGITLYLEGPHKGDGFNLDNVRAKLEEKEFSSPTIDIITRLLAFDPADRITPLEVLEHTALESVPDPFETIPGMDQYQWVLRRLKDGRAKKQQATEIAELTERLANL